MFGINAFGNMHCQLQRNHIYFRKGVGDQCVCVVSPFLKFSSLLTAPTTRVRCVCVVLLHAGFRGGVVVTLVIY